MASKSSSSKHVQQESKNKKLGVPIENSTEKTRDSSKNFEMAEGLTRSGLLHSSLIFR